MPVLCVFRALGASQSEIGKACDDRNYLLYEVSGAIRYAFDGYPSGPETNERDRTEKTGSYQSYLSLSNGSRIEIY